MTEGFGRGICRAFRALGFYSGLQSFGTLVGFARVGVQGFDSHSRRQLARLPTRTARKMTSCDRKQICTIAD